MAKISIKQASKYRTPFDLSSPHITTTDFGQLQVTNFLPVVPNDKFDISVYSEARCAPMVVPTFMDVDLVHRCFYVPMSAIYPAFESFYLARHDGGALAVPTITNAQLVYFFVTAANGLSREIPDDGEADFTYNSKNYFYTEKGRLFLKLLHSLGYGINYNASDTTQMSLLPLIAYMRVLYDYVYPSQYLDSLQLTKYFKCFTANELSSLWGTQNALFAFLTALVGMFSLPYRQDYFTAAWKDLNVPGATTSYPSKYTADGTLISSDDDKVSADLDTASPALSAYAVQLLQRMYEFVTRNNIVGNRFADRIFAKFGIGSRKSDPDMSQFVGQHIQPLRIADVTAMSAAANQDLGDLAGKMWSQGNGRLGNFETMDEFGYLMTLTFVQPKIGYYQGRRRWVTCNGQFDFFQPEFDMQMRAIRNDELFADYTNQVDYAAGVNYGGDPANTFGFAPNYSEFKKGDAYLTGDFRCKSLARNLDAYHLFRDLPTPSSESPLALNANFLFCQQHEFDKIFAQVYTLRYPITIRENAGYGNVICINNKPLVFTFEITGVTFVFVATQSDVAGLRFVGFRSDDHATHLSTLFGIDLSDVNTFYAVTPNAATSLGGVYNWSLFGQNFVLTDVTTGHSVQNDETPSTGVTAYFYLHPKDSPTSSSALGLVIHSFDGFLTYYQDYIDHIYLYLKFDIKATRNMAPISEEFMIQDGGTRLSVDMNGNRIV